MNEQITIKQARHALEATEALIPVLNQSEFFELMRFSKKVLDRYVAEFYPDGLPEEVAE